MAKIRIIGDVHGFYDSYIPIAQEADYSLQIGDMGFNYKPLEVLNKNKHKFIAGNHDNMDIYRYRHEYHAVDNGSDFGATAIGGLNFFFVRGGFSIDWKLRQDHYLRTGVKTYWDDEELSMQMMYQCLQDYKRTKPDFVITHECPRSISKRVGDNEILKRFGYNPDSFSTRTSELLEAMFQAHQPKRWIFGHYHKDWNGEINGTHFTCLDELSYMDMEI